MAITFQEIMDFYPKNNKSVFNEIKNTFSGLNSPLVPFIGAGLSAFCNYPSWPKALNELTESVYGEDNQKAIEQKIEKNELLEAAQDIKKQIRLTSMLQEMKRIFDYKNFDNCKQEDLKLSAAYLLPILFKNNPVMTTNFDTVIERMYANQNASFEAILSPSQSDKLTQIRQNGAHGLFKLHGTIGQHIISYNDLVFTKEQYDKYYNSKGELTKELTEWFKNKQLLFLGCSLSIDETIKLLKDIVDSNSAVCHYAIVSCKEKDMPTRIGEIGDIGVRAIFYPDGEYDSVRVILEHLLESLDVDAYRKLQFKITDCKEESCGEEKRFLYDSEYIPFTGRNSELKKLEEFCLDSKRICWWAVTGSGGIGKSRLVYEFKKKKEKEGWRVVWLKSNDYDILNELKLDSNRILVVADDVQANLGKIGKWLARISNESRSEALRVLLLERDGKDLDSATWSETLQDGDLNSIQKEKCYNDSFLELKALSESDLKNIIADYSNKRGKSLNSEQIERLLKALKSVDPDLSRPLYALAITDAFCNGDDPTRWDKNKLLGYVVNNEIDFYKHRLRNLWGGKKRKSPESELEKLLTLSCVYRMIPVDEIVRQASEDWKWLSKSADALYMDLEDMLYQAGVVHNVLLKKRNSDETVEVKAIRLDCPDLVKEYLVIKNTVDKNKFDLLLKPDWANDPNLLFFLIRILYDYPDKFVNKLKLLEQFLFGEPNNVFCQTIYYNLLVAVTTIKNEKIADQVVEKLKQNAEEAKGEFEYELYADAMANLSIYQSENYFLEVEQQLYELHERFISNKYIARSYMRLLSFYPKNIEVEKAKALFERVELIRSRFENDEYIASYYAEALLYSLDDIDLDNCREIFEQRVEKLKLLRERFNDNKVIAECYIRLLRWGIFIQPLDSHIGLLENIAHLKNSFHFNEDIANILYYDALIEMCCVFYTKYILNITDGVNLLSDVLNSKENILTHICSIFKSNSSECSKELSNNLDIASSCYNNVEAMEECAGSLVDLSLFQKDHESVIEMQNILELLRQHYPSNENIKLSYAMVCFNLTLKQSQADSMLSIQELRNYLLKNTSTNKRFQEELDKYLKKYPNDREKYKSLIMLS